MEVGRLGVKFGIEPPTLIKLEMSLEDPMPAPPKGASTLDEKVLHVPLGVLRSSHLSIQASPYGNPMRLPSAATLFLQFLFTRNIILHAKQLLSCFRKYQISVTVKPVKH